MAVASRQRSAGLGILFGLGVLDLFSPLIFPSEPTVSADGPPDLITYLDMACGVLTVIGAILWWRSRSNAGKWMVVITRIISALTAVPGLLFAPGSIKLLVAVFLVITIVGLVLFLKKDKR